MSIIIVVQFGVDYEKCDHTPICGLCKYTELPWPYIVKKRVLYKYVPCSIVYLILPFLKPILSLSVNWTKDITICRSYSRLWATQPKISQFQSLIIHRSTVLYQIKLVLFLGLQVSECSVRDWGKFRLPYRDTLGSPATIRFKPWQKKNKKIRREYKNMNIILQQLS